MAEKIWIGPPSLNHAVAPSATLTRVGQELTPDALDVSNLAGPDAQPPWQTPDGTTSATLRLDVGVAQTFRAIGLFRTNFRSSTTLSVTMSTTAAGGSDAYTSGGAVSAGVVTGLGQALHILPSPVVARFVDIVVDDTGNPDGHLLAGLIFTGDVWTPSRNFQFGSALITVAGAVRASSAGGQSFRQANFRKRSEAFTLRALKEAEVFAAGGPHDLDRESVLEGNWLVIPRPEGAHRAREAIFGELISRGISRRFHNHFGWTFEQVERL